MGQVQSEVAAAEPMKPTPSSSSSSSSMESLIAEAAAYGSDGDESLDVKAHKALECPCIADLRSGPCGLQFSDAFLCFLKSSAEEKGSDCVHPFVALQKCIKVNPDAFSRDILEENEVKQEDKETPEFKIIPPDWSKESRSAKSAKSKL